MSSDNNAEMALVARIANVEANEKGDYPFTISRHSSFPLVLVHYKDDAVENVTYDAPIRNLRGTIIDIETEQIVCSSVGYISKAESFKSQTAYKWDGPLTDYSPSHWFAKVEFKIREGMEIRQSDLHFTPIYEGALIRVWRYRGVLMYSSHRAIDCTESKWGPSGKFKELFQKYAEGLNLDEMIVDGRVSSFILMNADLLLASKMDFAGRNGFLIYVGTRPVTNNDISYDFTFPCVTGLANPDNTDKHVFSPEIATFRVPPTWKNYIVTCKMDDGVRLVRKIDPLYERELDIVGSDPNILHRCFDLIDDAKFLKGTDRYLVMYPPVPVLSKSQIAGLEKPFRSFEDIPGIVYTAEQLTDKKDKQVHMRRIVNILTHYAMAISPCNQLAVFKSIYPILEKREKLAQLLFLNNKKFGAGDFGSYKKTKKDETACGYVQKKIQNAVSFTKNHFGNQKVTDKEFAAKIKSAIWTSVMNYDDGTNTYRMIRTFIDTDVSKV